MKTIKNKNLIKFILSLEFGDSYGLLESLKSKVSILKLKNILKNLGCKETNLFSSILAKNWRLN